MRKKKSSSFSRDAESVTASGILLELLHAILDVRRVMRELKRPAAVGILHAALGIDHEFAEHLVRSRGDHDVDSGRREQVIELSGAEQMPLLQNRNPVADLLHVGKNMAAEEHAGSLFLLFNDDLLELLASIRVESEERFVENQQFRLVEQSLRHADTLEHAARKRTEFLLRVIRHFNRLKRLVNRFIADVGGNAQEFCANRKEFARGQLFAECGGVGQKTDAFFDFDIVRGFPEHRSQSLRWA